ncbi:aldo/keto reductase [Pseudoalteromonas piscicida]|uniref:Aldo/keto reductase n=1 Tax=Pseudoalteromonas piscicida TaxID=43662 RepID=A0AAD0RI80_PSEO7|nr:aldo/keto reductase [Pseudoalteromonas piscicida]ASD66058.1 aldo/keto reductase [Pseudoalteromonas piscicida]AXQ96984.1 aldo/keto reductase [Pseudoalteromonas piscicida]AXR03240.1 aldo/keto reductase [Pseudoalteromonas piscicida]
MKYSRLGSSPLEVSRICLGSMTWGVQNNQHDADEQINYALSRGINFIDTAEMYAVPPSPETYGKTEAIIGNWLKRHQEKREKLVLATKIAGSGLPWIREGGPITGQSVIQAVDDSLARLNTDYIDLYQLHWPNRTSPHFGKQWPGMVPLSALDRDEERAGMLDILEGLASCIQAGKIRHWGLSDDTPWGIHTYLNLATQHDLPKPVSIQNEFSLLHAKDWPYLIESCVNEDIAYLPWSPLAGGMLSGKYLGGARPEGSRFTLVQRQGLFRDTQLAQEAVAKYLEIAKEFNMTAAQLALAWCNQVDGVTSTIIGATTMAQLKENIQAFEKPLCAESLAEIDTVFKAYPAPF